MSSNLVSKHLLRRDIERDPDHINQMLWKRKLYKKRVQRNEQKKVRKQFFKTKEEMGEDAEVGDVALVNEGTIVDDKKKEFYKQLFAKTEGDEEPEKKKKKKKKAKAETKTEDVNEEVKEQVEIEEKEKPQDGASKDNKTKKGSFNN